jgi:hypothetical protein
MFVFIKFFDNLYAGGDKPINSWSLLILNNIVIKAAK